MQVQMLILIEFLQLSDQKIECEKSDSGVRI